MEKKQIQEQTFQFSLSIIEVYKKMLEQREFIISKQIFRSATSIGANVAESQGGVSLRDFKYKMSIALKEALETRYWLQLLKESRLVLVDLTHESEVLESIINLLYKIVKTATAKLQLRTKHYTLDTAPNLGID